MRPDMNDQPRLWTDTLHSDLEACDRELLEIEGKYGLAYEDFDRKLEVGGLGNEFGYQLEMDAMRWGDLIAEKGFWLEQLSDTWR